MVVQDQPIPYGNRTGTLINPKLIIEVFSKATEEYDQGDKLKLYRSIPNLQEYVLISQSEPEVQQYTKSEAAFGSIAPTR